MLWPVHPHLELLPLCQNYDSSGCLCGWLWAQGYNLNCKKIKQFLISSIATALLLVPTFIFISVTSQTHILSLPLSLYHTLFLKRKKNTPFSQSDDLTLCAFHIVERAWKHILFSCRTPNAPQCHVLLLKCIQETFSTVSESKPPFSKQSFREYIRFIIWNRLTYIIIPFNTLSGSV